MKAEILALLRGSEQYISGQELCTRFGVSRTAVWKVINQLKEEGYMIEASPKKGYRLMSTPDLMSASEVKSRVKGNWLGEKIYFYEETGSTNTDVKRLAEQGEPSGIVVVSDKQNAGKGRRGRQWESVEGKNIFFSILLRPPFAPEQASMLTLLMAMAGVEAVNRLGHVKAMIKWPNDLVVNGKKVCGILTEMNMESDYIQYVVIGMGINVNQEIFSHMAGETATSLFLESGVTTGRAALLAEILFLFEEKYNLFCKTMNMEVFIEEYNNQLVNRGKSVKILDPQGEFFGEAQGINARGELLVKKDEGEVVAVYAGEVSVRGILGYI